MLFLWNNEFYNFYDRVHKKKLDVDKIVKEIVRSFGILYELRSYGNTYGCQKKHYNEKKVDCHTRDYLFREIELKWGKYYKKGDTGNNCCGRPYAHWFDWLLKGKEKSDVGPEWSERKIIFVEKKIGEEK